MEANFEVTHDHPVLSFVFIPNIICDVFNGVVGRANHTHDISSKHMLEGQSSGVVYEKML